MLRDDLQIRIRFEDLEVAMSATVVRKEVEPRSGLGLHIAHMSAPEEKIWEQILRRAQKNIGTPS